MQGAGNTRGPWGTGKQHLQPLAFLGWSSCLFPCICEVQRSGIVEPVSTC